MDTHIPLKDRLAALYRLDDVGRMLTTNEWDARPAPRFHLMRTASGPLWLCGAEVPSALAGALGDLARREPWDPAPDALPVHHDRYLELLGPVTRIWTGPGFVAPPGLHAAGVAVAVDETNAGLLAHLFPDWVADVPHRRPFMTAIEGDRAVALCASVRISASVHCAGVETHPAYRRRGHALAAVADWAEAVRGLGAAPFYSTSWDNQASRAVAARLGFSHVACDYHLT